jgi:hypothetical protein
MSLCVATNDPWPMCYGSARDRLALVRRASHPSHAPSCTCTMRRPARPLCPLPL